MEGQVLDQELQDGPWQDSLGGAAAIAGLRAYFKA